MSGAQGGAQQIVSRIAYNEIDMVLLFRDPLTTKTNEITENNLLHECDVHNIPIATNIATAEVLIHGLERGDLDWRNIVNPQIKIPLSSSLFAACPAFSPKRRRAGRFGFCLKKIAPRSRVGLSLGAFSKKDYP